MTRTFRERWFRIASAISRHFNEGHAGLWSECHEPLCVRSHGELR